MKSLRPVMTLLCAAALCACSSDSPADIQAKAEKIEAKAAKDLESKDLGEIIDYLDGEAKEMTKIMKTVTDGPSAESAIRELRVTAPRLKAAMEALQAQDIGDIETGAAAVSKMPALAKTQAEMVKELTRVHGIPDARAVLDDEFDKMGIIR